jgi:hypothetical protein
MKWVIFTGTWRLTNEEVEQDVRAATREVISRGDGIVTGGATGVDYFCMDELLKLNPSCTRIRIFIPSKLDHFISDYRKNWCHDPVTQKDIDNIESVLNQIKDANPACIFEVARNEGDITQADYDQRHNEEVVFSDEVYAFQVNNSTGTQDTIDKAAKAGLAISLHKKYTI